MTPPGSQSPEPAAVGFLRENGHVHIDRLTDGRVACCICFDWFTRDQLADVEGEPGMKWDVCHTCDADEGTS